MAKRQPKQVEDPTGPSRGNYVAEWFGFRVWPNVDRSEQAALDQAARRCPFLTIASRVETECVKAARGYDEPTGVCTISSDSNGERQDWLACPYRILDQHFTVLGGAVRTVFGIPVDSIIRLLPTTVLNAPAIRAEVTASLSSGIRVFAFCGNKFGGEVDIPETDSSPGGKVDVSVIEILGCDESGKPDAFGEHMFFEIQTADFHGSPLPAVQLLREKCPRNSTDDFHTRFANAPNDCGRDVEGPNKANIFKRTIYQMVWKMELAKAPNCAGFAIILPVPVWQSWLRHLGNPKLDVSTTDPTVFFLTLPDHQPAPPPINGGPDRSTLANQEEASWVFVFDIDRDSNESPRPLRIVYRVHTPARSLLYYAFEAAPLYAIENQVIEQYRKVLIGRVAKGWGR